MSLSTEGLRRYHELCVVPAPPEALNKTWYDHSRWVSEHVPQADILALNVAFWQELGPISQINDDSPEGLLVKALHDACEIVWYAMDETTRERCEALIGELAREEDGQSLATGADGSSTR